MRVTQVLLARSARFVEYPRPPFFPDVIRRLQERYSFVHVPTTPDEIVPRGESSGILGGFLHGKHEYEGRTIVIKSLSFFADAVAVESLVSTEDADVVLDDLLTYGADLMVAQPHRRAYASGLEFNSDVALWSTFRVAHALGQAMAQLYGSYADEPAPTFDLSGFTIATDPTKGSAEEFLLARRANTPFESNSYYSHAPLSSPHHVSLLEGAEMGISEAMSGGTASPIEPPPPSSR